MTKAVTDQADGLRRLMARKTARLIAVVGSQPQAGATSVALNLSAALAQQGSDVLLLDEQCGPQSAQAIWGISAAGAWADVAAQRLPLAAALGSASCGVGLLPAPRGATSAASVADPRPLLEGKVVVIDAALDSDGALSPLARAADDVVVVLRPQAQGITAAYACIKRLHYAHALQGLRILVNRASSQDEARRILVNLSGAGSRYLALSLQPAGHVSDDPLLPQAHGLRLGVVEAFPASRAAGDFRRLACGARQWPLRAPAPAVDNAAKSQADPVVESK